MKQKWIYIVLLCAGVQIPAPSKECGSLAGCIIVKKAAVAHPVNYVPADYELPGTVLPMSPLSSLLYHL